MTSSDDLKEISQARENGRYSDVLQALAKAKAHGVYTGKEPELCDAHLEALVNLDKIDDASKVLAEALEGVPDDQVPPVLVLDSAVIAVRQERYQDAVDAFDRARSLGSYTGREPELVNLHIQALLGLGLGPDRVGDASKVLAEALAGVPDDQVPPVLVVDKAVIAFRQQRYQDAAAAFDRARSLGAYTSRETGLFHMHIQALLGVGPDRVGDASKVLAEALAGVSDDQVPPVLVLDSAVIAVRQERYQDAVDALQRARSLGAYTGREPGLVDLQIQALLGVGPDRVGDASKVLAEALAGVPDDQVPPVLVVDKAVIAFRQQRYQDAAAAFDRARSLGAYTSRETGLFHMHIQALLGVGPDRVGDASKVLAEALAGVSDDQVPPVLVLDSAVIAVRQERYQDAVDALQRARSLGAYTGREPGLVDLQIQALLGVGPDRVGDASKVLAEALEGVPDDQVPPVLVLDSAVIAVRQERYQDAVDALQRARSLGAYTGREPELVNLHIQALLGLGLGPDRVGDASKVLAEALAGVPDDQVPPVLVVDKAVIAFRQQRYQDAAAAFDRARSLGAYTSRETGLFHMHIQALLGVGPDRVGDASKVLAEALAGVSDDQVPPVLVLDSAVIAVRQERYQDAVDALQRARSLGAYTGREPGLVDLQIQALLGVGPDRVGDASKVLAEALAGVPDDQVPPVLVVDKAVIAFRQQRYQRRRHCAG